MHPKLMMALAAEVERGHRSERQSRQLRSEALGDNRPSFRGPRMARGFLRRRFANLVPKARIQMKYLMLVCVDPSVDLSPEERTAIGPDVQAWVEEMDTRGVRVHGHELAGVNDATTVRNRAAEIIVTDGPFAETKEHIGGFDILDCSTIDEAVEVAALHPVARFGSIEVRAFLDESD
jgi:hypothetical protein